MVSVSFIPSVVCGKLVINTVEFNSRKVSCFQLSIYCLCRTTFHYAMREWAEFFIFNVRTDSCLCWVLNCYIKMLEILLFWYNFVMNSLKLLIKVYLWKLCTHAHWAGEHLLPWKRQVLRKMPPAMSRVTDNENFNAVCTNPAVIETAFNQYLENEGPIDDEPLNEYVCNTLL